VAERGPGRKLALQDRFAKLVVDRGDVVGEAPLRLRAVGVRGELAIASAR